MSQKGKQRIAYNKVLQRSQSSQQKRLRRKIDLKKAPKPRIDDERSVITTDALQEIRQCQCRNVLFAIEGLATFVKSYILKLEERLLALEETVKVRNRSTLYCCIFIVHCGSLVSVSLHPDSVFSSLLLLLKSLLKQNSHPLHQRHYHLPTMCSYLQPTLLSSCLLFTLCRHPSPHLQSSLQIFIVSFFNWGPRQLM